MILARLLRRWSIGKDKTTAAVADNRIIRPDFETMFFFWTGLLAERGLSEAVRWVFHEDFARVYSTASGNSGIKSVLSPEGPSTPILSATFQNDSALPQGLAAAIAAS